MRVFTKVRMDIKTGTILEYSFFEYTGAVSFAKGATSAEVNLQNQQAQFYKTLSANYATQFANQSAILSSLQKSFQPILDQGIYGFGFNPAETAALRTQASEGTAQTYAQAAAALGQNTALQTGGLSRGAPIASGGETYIPSGNVANEEAALAGRAAAQESAQQLGITEAGYAQGRQNYLTAAQMLSGVSGQYNPLGYAGSATSAGGTAFNSAAEIQKQNAAASPWGAIGGILGGVAGSFLGPIGTSLGSSIGSAIGGAGSGGSSTPFSDFNVGGSTVDPYGPQTGSLPTIG